jgi:hypothetical protein
MNSGVEPFVRLIPVFSGGSPTAYVNIVSHHQLENQKGALKAYNSHARSIESCEEFCTPTASGNGSFSQLCGRGVLPCSGHATAPRSFWVA